MSSLSRIVQPILQGKGIFIHVINRVLGGNVELIAKLLKAAGISHVIVKFANGATPYNSYLRWLGDDGKFYEIWTSTHKDAVDHVAPLVAALQAVGIEVWGFQYIYGSSDDYVRKEAEYAVRRVIELGLDGLVVNAEVQFKAMGEENARRRALIYMNIVRDGLAPLGIPIAFSSYKYPTYHRPLPFDIFLELSDVNMPQVYPVQDTRPNAHKVQMERSLIEYGRIYDRIGHAPQTVPTIATYKEHGWVVTPAQVTNGLQAALDFEFAAVNSWELHYAMLVDGVWEAFAGFEWPEPIEAEEPERELNALELYGELKQRLKEAGLPYPV